MKRYAAFEPAEYTAWTADAAVHVRFQETLDAHADRAKLIAALPRDHLLLLYRGLVRNRLTDIALKRMVWQGVISKAWLGMGEEAATIGPVHALEQGTDIVAPMIRNGGACVEFGMSVADVLRAYMATGDSPSHGRDGHYGAFPLGVLAPVSPVGHMVAIVAGVALAARMRNARAVALTWIGDGTTKAGVVHESLNFAAVQRLPAIFIIQNNQVALGTKLEQHHLTANRDGFARWPEAYGMWGAMFDGNNVLDAWAATTLAAQRCRAGEGPALLIAETFRMGGHATHDEAEARRTFPARLFKDWGARDPIGCYEEWLMHHGVERDVLSEIEREVELEVEQGEADALESRQHAMPAPESALDGVYASNGGGQSHDER